MDVGQITLNGKNKEGTSERKTIEVDFVCNKGYERVYIQSALNLPTAEKQAQEMRPLLSIKDSFKKVSTASLQGRVYLFRCSLL